jgi:hypothetical protein
VQIQFTSLQAFFKGRLVDYIPPLNGACNAITT